MDDRAIFAGIKRFAKELYRVSGVVTTHNASPDVFEKEQKDNVSEAARLSWVLLVSVSK